MSYFEQADAIVAGIEAGLSMDRNDKGNWTGGAVGAGELKGTKYGISAAAFPTTDIAALTLDQARALRKSKYWDVIGAAQLPWAMALCTYDCAINQGQHAEELLASHSHDVTEFMAQRILRYTRSAQFAIDGHGWVVRVLNVFKEAQVLPNGSH